MSSKARAASNVCRENRPRSDGSSLLARRASPYRVVLLSTIWIKVSTCGCEEEGRRYLRSVRPVRRVESVVCRKCRTSCLSCRERTNRRCFVWNKRSCERCSHGNRSGAPRVALGNGSNPRDSGNGNVAENTRIRPTIRTAPGYTNSRGPTISRSLIRKSFLPVTTHRLHR